MEHRLIHTGTDALAFPEGTCSCGAHISTYISTPQTLAPSLARTFGEHVKAMADAQPIQNPDAETKPEPKPESEVDDTIERVFDVIEHGLTFMRGLVVPASGAKKTPR